MNALSILQSIQTHNEQIRVDYFNRDRILEQLRSDVYFSGTYARDLLLERDSKRADLHRRELQETKRRIDENVRAYRKVLRTEERVSFLNFKKEVDEYFLSLEPAVQWNAEQRKALGYAFMTDFLLPRRMVIVHLAEQISDVNQQQMSRRQTDQSLVLTVSRLADCVADSEFDSRDVAGIRQHTADFTPGADLRSTIRRDGTCA